MMELRVPREARLPCSPHAHPPPASSGTPPPGAAWRLPSALHPGSPRPAREAARTADLLNDDFFLLFFSFFKYKTFLCRC